MIRSLSQQVLNASHRLAMPILTYPGAPLRHATVREMVTSASVQADVQAALCERYGMTVVLSAMDLSVESQAFGCEIKMSDHEIPTVIGRHVTTREAAEKLAIPQPGDGRTGVYLETVSKLAHFPGRPWVLAGMIGPFSLAGRLFGVSEALGLTLEDPDLTKVLLEKCTCFLIAYAQAFKKAGADGVIMAEPTAGLLSPRGMEKFSSRYIRKIVTATADPQFTIIVHNCAAKALHLPALLAAGASAYHFGAPMDIATALAQVPKDILIAGNLDPAAIFLRSQPAEIHAAVSALLVSTRAHPNFILSSGCDVPPGTPLANIDAFFKAAAQ
jgi:uroporphyrinogen decarboxylase